MGKNFQYEPDEYVYLAASSAESAKKWFEDNMDMKDPEVELDIEPNIIGRPDLKIYRTKWKEKQHGKTKTEEKGPG